MEEKHKCPVCGEFEFEEYNSLEICEVCGWQDDAVQEAAPNSAIGANHMSLNQAKKAFRQKGVCKSWLLPEQQKETA